MPSDDGPPTLISEEALIHEGARSTEVFPAVTAETSVLPPVLPTGPQTVLIDPPDSLTPPAEQTRADPPVSPEGPRRRKSTPKHRATPPEPQERPERRRRGDSWGQVIKTEFAKMSLWTTMGVLFTVALVGGLTFNQFFGPDTGPFARLKLPVTVPFVQPKHVPDPPRHRFKPVLPEQVGHPHKAIPKPTPSVIRRMTPPPSASITPKPEPKPSKTILPPLEPPIQTGTPDPPPTETQSPGGDMTPSHGPVEPTETIRPSQSSVPESPDAPSSPAGTEPAPEGSP